VADNQYKGILLTSARLFFIIEGCAGGFGTLMLINVAPDIGVEDLNWSAGICSGCLIGGGVTDGGFVEKWGGGKEWITENCPLLRSSFRLKGAALTLSMSLWLSKS
jgi:hypothetical protein